MKKITSKKGLILYACSGLGVNMLGIIVGSYLCSALLVGGFDAHASEWTYLNRDLVVAGLWAVLVVVAKVIDGLIDLPFSFFSDLLRAKFGSRTVGLIVGLIPTIIAYLLFLVPITPNASVINTIWFALLLCLFYASYTFTMITYYATFAEITENEKDIDLLANVKSICDVVYFSLSFALVPAFVSMGLNIRIIALIFLPLSLTMLIPMFMMRGPSKNKEKEHKHGEESVERLSMWKAILFALTDWHYFIWLCVLFVMNMGTQIFLSGINEYFSTTGINMTFVMAFCFAPVPFSMIVYNKLLAKKGLGFAFRYVLVMFSIGMGLMGFARIIPSGILLYYAIGCSIIVSFALGAFFAVTYSVPSHRAAVRREENRSASSMYYAIQGLFEAVSAGIATGPILVFLKQSGNVKFMTVAVAAICMGAFFLSFALPKDISLIGKVEKKAEIPEKTNV